MRGTGKVPWQVQSRTFSVKDLKRGNLLRTVIEKLCLIKQAILHELIKKFKGTKLEENYISQLKRL